MSGVWVTGFGCITAVGKDAPSTLNGVAGQARPQSSPDMFSFVQVDKPMCLVADAWLPGEKGSGSWRRHTAADTITLLRAAVREALDVAGLEPDSLASDTRVGVCIGTTACCSLHVLADHAALRADNGKKPEYGSLRDYYASSPALLIATEYGLGPGPALSISNSCTSGTDAIGLGKRWIDSGQCDIVLAGGADALSDVPFIGFSRLLVFSSELCKPFDKERLGLNLGEGAGVLVLESSEHAARRGVRRPRAVLSGFGAAGDAHHISSPHPSGRGLCKAISEALAEGGATLRETGFINAHGTATLENDKIESRVYAELENTPPVWASKGSTGHCLGAAGAVEAVLSVLALESGSVPASTGCGTPEDGIEGLITLEPGPVKDGHALSVSLGFGGSNAALLFSLPDAR